MQNKLRLTHNHIFDIDYIFFVYGYTYNRINGISFPVVGVHNHSIVFANAYAQLLFSCSVREKFVSRDRTSSNPWCLRKTFSPLWTPARTKSSTSSATTRTQSTSRWLRWTSFKGWPETLLLKAVSASKDILEEKLWDQIWFCHDFNLNHNFQHNSILFLKILIVFSN